MKIDWRAWVRNVCQKYSGVRTDLQKTDPLIDLSAAVVPIVRASGHVTAVFVHVLSLSTHQGGWETTSGGGRRGDLRRGGGGLTNIRYTPMYSNESRHHERETTKGIPSLIHSFL